MNLTIQSIHFDADQKLKDYIQKKCDKLDQFFDRITDAEVFLKVVKPGVKDNKTVEIKLNVPGDILMATENADTFEAATDLATCKMKAQLLRYKDKLRTS